jgi:hypothetical protein
MSNKRSKTQGFYPVRNGSRSHDGHYVAVVLTPKGEPRPVVRVVRSGIASGTYQSVHTGDIVFDFTRKGDDQDVAIQERIYRVQDDGSMPPIPPEERDSMWQWMRGLPIGGLVEETLSQVNTIVERHAVFLPPGLGWDGWNVEDDSPKKRPRRARTNAGSKTSRPAPLESQGHPPPPTTARETLSKVFNEHPNLTFGSVDYEELDYNSLPEADKAAHKLVDSVLRGIVPGFQRFQNFNISKSGLVRLRYQVDYNHGTDNHCFVGVHYHPLKDF